MWVLNPAIASSPAWHRGSAANNTHPPRLPPMALRLAFGCWHALHILPPICQHDGAARMQAYDVLMLIVLGLAIVWGAWKGLAWQIASIASIGVSYFVALHFRQP